MKIAAITWSGQLEPLIEKMPNASLRPDGRLTDCDVAFLEDPLTEFSGNGCPLINSSDGVRALMMDKEMQSTINDMVGVVDDDAETSIYYPYDGEFGYSPIEISVERRMMSGDIGVQIPFATGAALPVGNDFDAKPMLDKVNKVASDLGYLGEITIGVSEKREITGFAFGHHPYFFPMYCATNDIMPEQLLGLCVGDAEHKGGPDRLTVAITFHKFPYPMAVDGNYQRVRIPSGMREYAWEVRHDDSVCYLLVSSHGDGDMPALSACRRSLYRMTNTIRRVDPDIQYRTDAGYGMKFLTCQERFEKMSRKPG